MAPLETWAGESPTKSPTKPSKIAVLDPKARGSVEPKTIDGLAGLVAGETAKHGLQVTAGADLSALLGFEKQRQLLGCSDSSCMAELAGGLGVQYLLYSEIAKVGGVLLISMSLLDTSKGRAVLRSSEQVESERDLVAATLKAVRSLLKQFDPPVLGAAGLVSSETAPPSGSPQRTAGFVLGGAGLALLAAGGISGGLVLDSTSKARAAVDRGDSSALANAKSEAQLRMNVADACYAAGVVALATGVVVALTAPSAPATISLAPMGRGIGLSAAGVFP